MPARAFTMTIPCDGRRLRTALCAFLSAIAVGQAPQGDTCATALTAIENGATPFSAAGNSVPGPSIPPCGGGTDPFDVWFAYNPTLTGVATATFCPTSQFAAGGTSTPSDTALSLWNGTCGGLTQASCSTSSPTCGGGPAELSFAVAAGTTVYLRAVAEGGGSFSGALALAAVSGPCPAPSNDAPGAAPWVTANLQEPATYDNSCANADLPAVGYGPPTPPLPPKPNRDVWICFTDSDDVCYRLTNLALFDTEIEIFVQETTSNGTVYTREAGTSGEAYAHGTSNGLFVTSTTFCFCANKKYWIALASTGAAGGLITLSMTTCNAPKFTVDGLLVKLEAIGDGSAGGSSGDSVHLFFTTNQGTYPKGWFFGIDLGLFELFQQLSLAPTLGPLVQGTLNVDLKYEFLSLPAAPSPLSGLTLYVTTVFFTGAGTIADEICPAKIVFP
jgi:hypothetical protein